MRAGRAGLFALRQGLEDPFRPEAGLSESLAFKVHPCAPLYLEHTRNVYLSPHRWAT